MNTNSITNKQNTRNAADVESTQSVKNIGSYHKRYSPIVDAIKHNERFAYEFFYGTSHIPDRCIAGLRMSILGDIRRKYNVDLEPYVFNTLLYEHLWSDGTWRVLEKYSYKSTLFQWLRKVAYRCTLKYLEDNNYIKQNPLALSMEQDLEPQKLTVENNGNPLRDVLGFGNMSDAELEESIVAFLYDFSNSLPIGNNDKYIWQERFINNASPVEMAAKFGYARSWIDNRYSKTNCKFKIYVQDWYNRKCA